MYPPTDSLIISKEHIYFYNGKYGGHLCNHVITSASSDKNYPALVTSVFNMTLLMR
jgi:hypothetical protein